MLTAHGSWANHMINECTVEKKQTKRTFKIFTKYHHAFMEKIIVNLVRNSHEINLKGTVLALHSGNIAKLKLRHNMRLMHTFAIKGVEALARERISLGGGFEHMTVRYYDIASRYS
jgi:hypothetical protein